MLPWAALALLLYGCGWSGAGESDGTGRGALDIASRAGYARARLESAVLESYLDIHPGLRVVQRRSSSDRLEFRRQMLNAMRAGTPPDVIYIDLGDTRVLADHGVLLDLSPYLARVGVTVAEYDSTVLSAFARGRALYALPTGYSPLVVAYNKDLFDRAGLAGPGDDWTWDEFLAAAKRLTRDSDGDGATDIWGTTVDDRVAVWLAWVWAGGGDVLCADGKRATGCLDSPATVAALRWYAAWVTQERIAAPALADDPIGRFLAGKVAMLTVEHSAVPRLRSAVSMGRLRVGLTEIPHRTGYPTATVLSATGYAVPALALRRKLAVELVAALTDSLAGRIRGNAGVELPALAHVALALAARDTLGWEPVFLRAASHGRLPWESVISRWGDVDMALHGLMDRIMYEDADPDAAAHDLASQLDHLLSAAR